jgi:hypothetical protein
MFYMFAKLNLYMIGCYGAATGIAAEIKSASFDSLQEVVTQV